MESFYILCLTLKNWTEFSDIFNVEILQARI